MSQPVDRSGHFRGLITEYGIREEQSGAVAIGIKVALTEYWDPDVVIEDVKGNWVPWDQYDMETEGFIYIVDKKAQVLSKNVESFVKFAGWDSTFDSIESHTWQPAPMGVTVTEEEYKSVKKLRASFINAHDWTPGARSNVNSSRVKELSARFGGQLRAVAGNAKRGSAPPTGKPTPPPPPSNGHNPTSISVWTKEQAVKACNEAGVNQQDLETAIEFNGRSGWSMTLDTPLAKALIAEKKKVADIPFAFLIGLVGMAAAMMA